MGGINSFWKKIGGKDWVNKKLRSLVESGENHISDLLQREGYNKETADRLAVKITAMLLQMVEKVW